MELSPADVGDFILTAISFSLPSLTRGKRQTETKISVRMKSWVEEAQRGGCWDCVEMREGPLPTR